MRSTNNPSIDTYFPIILLFLCFGIRVSHSSPTGALEARTTASVSLFSLREDVPNSLNLAPPTYPFIPPYPHRLFARQQQQQQHVNATNSTTHLNATNPTVENVQAFVNSLKTGTGHGLASATNKISKIYTQVNDAYLAIALIPAFILCYGSVSSFLKEKLYLGEAMLAVMFGIFLGPYVTNLMDPRSWGQGASFNEVTLEITRVVVALDVFSAGVELPPAYLLRHWRTMTCLLGPVVLAGWFISGALIFALLPALSYLEALVIAACVCPTDILLASSVIGKGRYAQKHVPSHVQHLLHAEAGANDGVAIILLYFSLFLVLRDTNSVKHAVGSWFLLGLLYHIIVGILMGIVIGILARIGLKFSKRHSLIDKGSTMVALYIALALMTAGVSILAGTDDIMAAFACGTAFAWDGWFSEAIEDSNFSAILSQLVNTTVFIYVGATIPFELWNHASLGLLTWRMALLAVSILVLRRLPVVILLRQLIPDIKTNKEAFFCGHFGPIGVSGLFISILATEKLPTPQIPPQTSLDVLALTIQPIMYLLLVCSMIVHGLSVPFFNLTKNFGSRVNSLRRSVTMTSSILNNFTRYDPVNTNHNRSARDEPVTPAATVPHSPTETINSRASDHEATSVGQTTKVEVDEVAEVEVDEGAHLKHEKRSLLREPEQKMAEDWVVPQPVDAPDGTKMYKCGQHLIIERGDGKELEVWRLQPASVHNVSNQTQLLSPSDSIASRDLTAIGVRRLTSGQRQPGAELGTSGKSRMEDLGEDKTFSEGSLSRKEASVGSPVGIAVNPSPLTPLPVDDGLDSGASSDWLDEDQPEKKPDTTALRPKLNHLVLRPRRFTPTSGCSVRRSRPKSGGINEGTVGDGADDMLLQRKYDSLGSPSKSLSPYNQTMNPSWSSQTSPVKRRGADLSPGVKEQTNNNRDGSTSRRFSQQPTSLSEGNEKGNNCSGGCHSKPTSPNMRNSWPHQSEPTPRRRRGTYSRPDPSRRVSFLDVTLRRSGGGNGDSKGVE